MLLYLFKFSYMSTLLDDNCCCKRCFLRQLLVSFLTEFNAIWVVFDFVHMSEVEIVATSSVFLLRPRLFPVDATANDSLLIIGFTSSSYAIELFVRLYLFLNTFIDAKTYLLRIGLFKTKKLACLIVCGKAHFSKFVKIIDFIHTKAAHCLRHFVIL